VVVVQGWDHGACFRDIGRIDRGDDNSWHIAAIRENPAPGIDDQRVAIGGPATTMGTALARSKDEAAGLDRAGAQEDMPMRLPRGTGEGGGNG